MPDHHIWMSRETEAVVESLMVRWGMKRSQVIARLVREAVEEA